MPLRFYDETTGNVVAEAVIPPEMKEALLLFAPIEPAPVSGFRYRIAVLDETGLRSGPRGLTIINLSGLALTGTVGKETVALEAGLNPTIALASATKVVLRTSAKGRSIQSYADTVLLKKMNGRSCSFSRPSTKAHLRSNRDCSSRELRRRPPKNKKHRTILIGRRNLVPEDGIEPSTKGL